MTPMLSYLVCATPRSGSTLLCHALDQTGVAGHPRGVLRGAAPLGPAAPSARVLRPRSPRQHRRAPRLSRDARRRGRAEPAVAPRHLRPLPRLGAAGGHDPQRRVRRQADVGLPRRLRRAAARDRRDGRAAAAGAARPRLPRPALRPDHAREQDPPGGLAVEGRADAGVEGASPASVEQLGRARCSPSARSTTSCAC